MVTVVTLHSTVTILVTDRGRLRALKAEREVLQLHFVGERHSPTHPQTEGKAAQTEAGSTWEYPLF